MLAFIKFKGNLSTRKSLLYVSSPRERSAGSFPEKRLVTKPTSFPGLFSFHFLREKPGDGTERDEVVIDPRAVMRQDRMKRRSARGEVSLLNFSFFPPITLSLIIKAYRSSDYLRVLVPKIDCCAIK